MLYLYNIHAYRSGRPVPNIFGKNVYCYTPNINTHTHVTDNRFWHPCSVYVIVSFSSARHVSCYLLSSPPFCAFVLVGPVRHASKWLWSITVIICSIDGLPLFSDNCTLSILCLFSHILASNFLCTCYFFSFPTNALSFSLSSWQTCHIL